MSSVNTIRFIVPPAAVVLDVSTAVEMPGSFTPEQIEAAREEGFRRGFDEASKYLSEQMLQQRSDLAHLQETTFQKLAAENAALLAQMRELLPQLAAIVAQRVLAGFEPDQQTVVRLASETLAEITPGSPGVEVWFHPRDLELVSALASDFAERYPGIQFHADSELQPGDCRARSRFGSIDGRLTSKLQNVARALT